MFERIVINRQGRTGLPIDLGFLAECLVFYRKVRVVCDPDTFSFLVRCCGPDELLDLMTTGELELEFFDNNTGVQTVSTNIGPLYELMVYTADKIRYPQVSRRLFDELCKPSGKGANRFVARFERMVKRSAYAGDALVQARSDWLDSAYTSSAVKSLLSMLAPEYPLPDPFIFTVDHLPEAAKTGGTFRVRTNIDFDVANASYHRYTPKEHSSLDPAHLLISIADTRRDLITSSRHTAEFAVSPEKGLVAACKFAEILSVANRGMHTSDIFQEAVVDNLPKIREAVNSGERNFADVLRLVRHGQRFKEWLSKHGNSEDLRTEYCREVSRTEWADKLPSKPLRWLSVNASAAALSEIAGHPVAGTIAANVLSAADFFLFDKLLKGWKPNQFVEGPLKQFLRIDENAAALRTKGAGTP